jgi:hypothetical protein
MSRDAGEANLFPLTFFAECDKKNPRPRLDRKGVCRENPDNKSKEKKRKDET